MKTNSIPLVDLNAQYESIKTEINAAIKKIIENSAFINGEDNRLFDNEFADYCDTKYAIGVGSGSVALDLALEALEIKQGDEVICPSMTFIATAEAISHRGAKPEFVDCEEDTYNIDPKLIEKKIGKKTKAIVAVHLHGNPADMTHILRIAKKYNLKVIEDAAQAHGAVYRGKKIGNFSDAAIFSFFPGKNLGCFGDGGAVVTNNKKIAEKIMLLKDHGRVEKYSHKVLGYGARLDNLQAAILRVKLRYLNKWNNRKREIAKIYTSVLSKRFKTPVESENGKSVYYVYTLRDKNRNKIMEALKQKGISSGIYYPIPLHLQPAYRHLKYKKGDLPISEKVSKEIFSIPIYPEMIGSQIDYVIKNLLDK